MLKTKIVFDEMYIIKCQNGYILNVTFRITFNQENQLCYYSYEITFASMIIIIQSAFDMLCKYFSISGIN